MSIDAAKIKADIVSGMRSAAGTGVEGLLETAKTQVKEFVDDVLNLLREVVAKLLDGHKADIGALIGGFRDTLLFKALTFVQELIGSVHQGVGGVWTAVFEALWNDVFAVLLTMFGEKVGATLGLPKPRAQAQGDPAQEYEQCHIVT